MADYYIASCMFTAQFPKTSLKMQNYIKTKSNIKIVRCCIPNYRVKQNLERISEDNVKREWEQPAKNSRLAPKHYVEQAKGKFIHHSQEEQISIMKNYCKQYSTDMIVCYCHYCLEGLIQGNVNGQHIATLLFPE